MPDDQRSNGGIVTRPAEHPPLLLVRVDGSVTIGTGHVMRCHTLAQAWRRRGGAVHFVMAESTPALLSRLQGVGEVTHLGSVHRGSESDARATAALAQEGDAAWIVADGYCFGSQWQRQVKESGVPLLLIDDFGHADHYSAEFVVNQNLHANPRFYASRERDTQLLLGTQYVLLRPEFLEWRSWSREIPSVARSLLLTFGGSDPHNATAVVLEAIQLLPDVESVVVVGGSNPHRNALEEMVRKRQPGARLIVDAMNMPELMAEADVAISAGGTTSWELAFMGLPSVVVTLAQNQVDVVQALSQAGIGIPAGLIDEKGFQGRLAKALSTLVADATMRTRMSRSARLLVDGFGSDRVVARMRSLNLGIRRVQETDARLLWNWANDPPTRSMSFSSEKIEWPSHLEWLQRKLSSPDCYFYLAMKPNGCPVGQVRFEVSSGRAIISTSLATEARGTGLGAAVIARGVTELFRSTSVRFVDAFIKPENQPSRSAFLKAGFQQVSVESPAFPAADHFVCNRPSHD